MDAGDGSFLRGRGQFKSPAYRSMRARSGTSSTALQAWNQIPGPIALVMSKWKRTSARRSSGTTRVPIHNRVKRHSASFRMQFRAHIGRQTRMRAWDAHSISKSLSTRPSQIPLLIWAMDLSLVLIPSPVAIGTGVLASRSRHLIRYRKASHSRFHFRRRHANKDMQVEVQDSKLKFAPCRTNGAS
jgi:hypothetical protein